MKTNKTLLWVGIGSALLIGGGLFWWFKNRPKKDDTEKEPVKDEDKSKQEESVIKTETDSTAPNLPSTPFKNKAEGDAFRNWMSVNHSDFRYKGDVLDKSGDYDNSFMRVAYDKYGKEYSSKITTDSGSGSTNFDTLQKNLNVKAKDGMVTVNFNGGKNKVTFFNNNRFSIGAVGQTGFLKKGSYSNGGLTFAIDGGSTFSSGSVWGNLITALK